MIDEQDLREALNIMEGYANTARTVTTTLIDFLRTMSTTTPELPDKPGFYLTQQHRLLFRTDDGDEGAWAAFNDDGDYCFHFWKPSVYNAYTKDPEAVYKALGPDAFPLVPLSEVILPSKDGD